MLPSAPQGDTHLLINFTCSWFCTVTHIFIFFVFLQKAPKFVSFSSFLKITRDSSNHAMILQITHIIPQITLGFLKSRTFLIEKAGSSFFKSREILQITHVIPQITLRFPQITRHKYFVSSSNHAHLFHFLFQNHKITHLFSPYSIQNHATFFFFFKITHFRSKSRPQMYRTYHIISALGDKKAWFTPV